MVTSLGDITLELNRAKAPVSTANFLKYVDKKFYDGTIFHRVIPDFMIQGGGFTPDMTQKRGEAPIKNEWQNGLKNARGSIAMARTSDPDSATSQFFINVKDNGFLDQARDGAAYAVFGKVVEGMATVDKIKAVATTDKGPYQNVPETAVVIKSARRLTDDEVKALKARLAKGEKK
jgi:cyclophilin family peptidyl-prolyl cis-trans isomerase